MLERFLQLEKTMHSLAEVPIAETLDERCERYERYREWVRLTSRARAFVEYASRDLGMDPLLMYEDPATTGPANAVPTAWHRVGRRVVRAS